MSALRFRHRHWSGWWKAAADAWQELVAKGCAGVDVFTCTETTVHAPTAPAGFSRAHIAGADAALYLRDAVGTILPGVAWEPIARTRYILGGKKPKPPLHALIVPTTIHTRPIVFAVIHQPSAIEGELFKDQAGTKLAFPRMRAFFEGLAGVRRAKRLAVKAHPGAEVILVQDSNTDFKRRWVRTFWRARFPRLVSSWVAPFPSSGTHGTRLIDVALHSPGLQTSGSTVESGMAPFDHRPFVTFYGFKAARKRRRTNVVVVKPPSPPYVGPAAHTSVGSNQPIRRVVIHCTVSPCERGGARATAAYFCTAASGGSAHYVVDPGEVVQVVYDDTIAWHAPPNQGSIGVELTDALVSQAWDKTHANRWKDADHVAMLDRAAQLVAQLCLAYDVPIVRLSSADLLAGLHGVCGHVDVSQAWHQSDHWDPGAAFPWTAFMAMVAGHAATLRKGTR